MNAHRDKIIILVLAMAGLLCLISDSYALVAPRGTDSTFEILTWNTHEFPGTGFRTIDTLAILINDLDIDMVALQEIEDTVSFRGLLARLPGWDGVYAPYDYYYQGIPYMKTAVIWRTDRASVNYIEQLFIGYEYQFPRPPIHVYATVNCGGGQFDFNLIVMHLKALTDEESQQRRRAAILMLKAYLDNNVPSAPDRDWVLVGDWNDELEDPQSDNVFWPLLTDSLDYRFLTLPMAGIPHWASYPYFSSLIDHIMITTETNDEYANGTTITLRLDDEYGNYAYRISDHRPVMSMFAGNPTSAIDAPLPAKPGLFTVYPNPFNSSAEINFELTTSSYVKLDIFDILGRKRATVVNGNFAEGNHSLSIDARDWPSGVYFAVFNTNDSRFITRMTLLK
jgi:endonuclease/exonuclease/phosphatase family metal-dependent hydrolase